jgi:hypothetical protein
LNVSKKIAAIMSIMLIVCIATSIFAAPLAIGQVTLPPGTHIATYANINVAPNPIGVGQTVNVNFYLASPLIDSSRPTNMTVKVTDPSGNVQVKGPYTGDTTGGTFFNFVPDKAGNWTFQLFYGGQVTAGSAGFGGGPPTNGGLIEDPSQSTVYTLVVQEEPIVQTGYPLTPLPTSYWETPVSAQNVQNWYKIMGPWLGLGTITFASTGAYNVSSLCNPYTPTVTSGHIIWTKTWGAGGVVGGSAGGTEDSGSYWSTRQYWPQYAPVIMNGKMYSTYYPETTGYSNGIVCTDLYTGENLWKINTTAVLRCGMTTQWKTPNMYGVVGPYIWTTGNLPASETGGKLIQSTGTEMGMFGPAQKTAYNLYSAETGQYVLSIVNASAMTLKEDSQGDIIGYYLNSTVGTMRIYGNAPQMGTQPLVQTVNITAGKPLLCCFNFTQALGNSWGWSPSQNTAIDFGLGVMWAKPVPTQINGKTISPALAMDSINPLGGDAVVLTGGYTIMQGGGDETCGWLVVASMDDTTGDVLMCKNFTYADGYQSLLPYTRTTSCNVDGNRVIANVVNNKIDAFNIRTGAKAWSSTLDTPSGSTNTYDSFGFKAAPVNGKLLLFGLGGDIWSYNGKTGAEEWYTNTTSLIGDSGIETPYGTWPLWVFSSQAYTPEVAYLAIGHEYNPPLFHGGQLLAVNMTDGTLVWSELGAYIRSVAIANGVLLSLNAYDNQIYAFSKGPTKITVDVPSIGVTTATPIRITGTITDVSAGVTQSEVAKNFPNGVPCVSDASQSKFMEHVYQDQPAPTDTTGVPITLSVVDQNGNYRTIGATMSTPSGSFGFTWTPDIQGDYQIYATFEGSNSYWPTSAGTSFYAGEAPTAAPTQVAAQTVDNTMLIVAIGTAVIIAIAIVGAVLLLAIRKRP